MISQDIDIRHLSLSFSLRSRQPSPGKQKPIALRCRRSSPFREPVFHLAAEERTRSEETDRRELERLLIDLTGFPSTTTAGLSSFPACEPFSSTCSAARSTCLISNARLRILFNARPVAGIVFSPPPAPLRCLIRGSPLLCSSFIALVEPHHRTAHLTTSNRRCDRHTHSDPHSSRKLKKKNKYGNAKNRRNMRRDREEKDALEWKREGGN